MIGSALEGCVPLENFDCTGTTAREAGVGETSAAYMSQARARL